MYKKIITVSLYNRPKYTAETLSALMNCDGIADYKVLFHCEPGCDEVRNLAENWPHESDVFVNAYRIGCNQNILGALNHGFRESDFVIMVEDDCKPARDFLKYMEWARENFMNDKRVFSVCGYRKGNAGAEDAFTVDRESHFTPWGWGTWGDRFDYMRRHWGIGTYDSWDMVVNQMRVQLDGVQVVPKLGRIQNIGAEQGTHVPNAAWHKENQFNEHWAESFVYERPRAFQWPPELHWFEKVDSLSKARVSDSTEV